MKLTGTAPQYTSTLTSVREYFTHLIKSRLQLYKINVDEFYLLSNTSCYAHANSNAIGMTFLLHMSFFIEEYVHRARTESILNELDNETHWIVVSQQIVVFKKWPGTTSFSTPGRVKVHPYGASFKSEPSIEAFSTHALIKMSNFQETCFIQHNGEKDFEPYQNFRSVPVSRLLLCDQLEFNKEEYTIKRLQMKITLYVINKLLEYNQFHLMPRGKLRVCVDDLHELTKISSEIIIINPLKGALETVTLVCTSLSLLCLILTFSVYCLCPKLRTIPGCNNMFLVGSLFIAQATFQFGNIWLHNTISCSIIGMITHVTWLSLFFWMNVCSFHMFRTFAFLRVVDNSDAIKYNTLLRYSLYAFGIPIGIVSANAIIRGYQLDWNYYGYGQVKCFIDDLISFVFTFLAPVILVCVLNLVFFCITSLKIKQTPTVQSSQDKRHFGIYIKLFIITGGTWVLVIVDSFLPLSALSFITTVMNACQGVFIFVSCVTNERTWKMIKYNTSKLLTGKSVIGSKSRSTGSTKESMLKEEQHVMQLKEN